MPLTIEQQRAVAIAQAKRRRAEAEAKAPPSPLRSETDAIIEEAAAAIPGGYEAFAAKPADPKRMAALGYTPDPLAKSGYSRPRAPQAPIVDSGQTTNLFTDLMRGLEAPIAGLTGGASGGGLEGWAKTTTQNPLLGATEAVNFLSPVDEAGRAYLGLRDTGAGLIEGNMAKAAQGAQQASIEGSFAALQALPGSMTLKGLSAPARVAPNTLAGAQRAAAQASKASPVRKSAPQVVEAPATTPEPFSAPAEPKAGSFLRNNADRIVGGGVGAFAGGAGDAIAAEGDGSGNGPDIINPVTGGLAGLIAPRMVTRGYRGIRDSAGFNQRVAARAVRNALSPVGRTADEIAAAQTARFGDKPAPLADLTQQAQNLAVGLTRLPGQAGQLAVEQSDDVLRTRTGRLFSDVETTTKINPASVAGDLKKAINEAAKEISPAYRKLYTDYQSLASDRLTELSKDRYISKYLKAAQQQAKSRAITAGLPYSDAHVWDLVKRGMDRTISDGFSGGKKPSEALLDAREAVRAELDNLMGEYKAIRDAADAPRMKAARQQGEEIAGGNMLVEQVRDIASGLKGRPLTALQMGAIKKLALDIQRARGIDGIASERMREILGAVFDDDTAAKLVARIRADQVIIKNAQRRNPNLGTATPQAMMGGAGGIQNAADLAQNALALKTNPLGTVLAALSKSGAYTKAQRDLIAQMLLGGADPENLARIYGRRGGPTRGGPASTPSAPPANVLAPTRPPEQAGFGGSRSLPMDEASRMQRAREQGFDTRYKLFHATSSDFDAFDTSKIRTDLQIGEDAIFLTNSPAVADSYLPGAFVNRNAPAIIEKGAQGVDVGGGVGRYYSKGAAVYPVFARNLKDYDVWDMGGGGYDPEFMQRAIKEAKESGAPGIILRGVRDPGIMDNIGPQGNPRKPAAVVVVFDPKDIRSVNAAFDPAESNSSKLLAGIGANPAGIGGAGGAVAGTALAPDTNGDGVIDAQERMAGGMGGLVTGVGVGMGANKLLGPRRGVSKAKNPGSIRFQGSSADAAASTNSGAFRSTPGGDNPFLGKNRASPQVQSVYNNAISEARKQYDYVGLRTVDGPLDVNNLRSRVWDDGAPTEQYLSGLSVTDAKAPKALSAHGLDARDWSVGYYPGDRTYVIAGNKASRGSDIGELIIEDPVVIFDPSGLPTQAGFGGGQR